MDTPVPELLSLLEGFLEVDFDKVVEYHLQFHFKVLTVFKMIPFQLQFLEQKEVTGGKIQ